MLKHLDEIKQIIETCEMSNAAATAAAPSSSREQLFDVISKLPLEAQTEMLALMWTGGPKNQDSFEENLALADKTRDENHAEVLSAQGSELSGFLNKGLRKVGTT